MSFSDFLPSIKTVATVAVSGLVGFGAGFGTAKFMGPEEFVPSKETCSRYYETNHGRFICIIAGKKELDSSAGDGSTGPVAPEGPEDETVL